jgi:hypothetical protein
MDVATNLRLGSPIHSSPESIAPQEPARLSAMKGRDRFTEIEAAEIRKLLRAVRRAEPGPPQKLLRDKLRAMGFYISDFATGPAGFTAPDFDDLVRGGRVTIQGGDESQVTKAASEPEPRPMRSADGPLRRRRTPPTASAAAAASSDDLEATARAARAALSAAPMSITAARSRGVPDCAGLYALYGTAAVWRVLGLGAPPDTRPLYVGKAEDSLVSRDLNTHFATGETGRSSPRRSFAALLAREGVLALVATPRRSHDPERKKWDCYALEPTGDEQLTKWMKSHLRIAVWVKTGPIDLTTVEHHVMRHWKPPLNLVGVKTHWRPEVKRARSQMVSASKLWARDRGFTV